VVREHHAIPGGGDRGVRGAEISRTTTGKTTPSAVDVPKGAYVGPTEANRTGVNQAIPRRSVHE
jgi:hypothetical protein